MSVVCNVSVVQPRQVVYRHCECPITSLPNLVKHMGLLERLDIRRQVYDGSSVVSTDKVDVIITSLPTEVPITGCGNTVKEALVNLIGNLVRVSQRPVYTLLNIRGNMRNNWLGVEPWSFTSVEVNGDYGQHEIMSSENRFTYDDMSVVLERKCRDYGVSYDVEVCDWLVRNYGQWTNEQVATMKNQYLTPVMLDSKSAYHIPLENESSLETREQFKMAQTGVNTPNITKTSLMMYMYNEALNERFPIQVRELNSQVYKSKQWQRLVKSGIAKIDESYRRSWMNVISLDLEHDWYKAFMKRNNNGKRIEMYKKIVLESLYIVDCMLYFNYKVYGIESADNFT